MAVGMGWIGFEPIIFVIYGILYVHRTKDTIVFFKRLGSQHIDKEIKVQADMNGIDHILFKTDLNLIPRLRYKCNTFSDVHFKACFKYAYTVVFTISIKHISKGGSFLLFN